MTKQWRLPTVINPVDRVCVQLQIPDTPEHIEAFWGALEALCKAWNWEYTTDKKGSQIAYVWQEVIDNAAELVRIGENCIVPIDCNEVEQCLQTSQTIADIIQDILDNQNAITNNANNISANTSAINQITTIDIPQINLTLDDYGTRISDLEVDASQKTLTLNDHETRISDLEVDASQKTLTLNDHETRITTLENSGGSGGSGNSFLATGIEAQVNTAINTTLVNTWETFAVIPHTFTYQNALIVVAVQCRTTNASPIGKIRISVGTATGVKEAWTQHTSAIELVASENFGSIPVGQEQSIFLDFQVEGGIFRIEDNQRMQIQIFEWSDSAPQSDSVTFDVGTYPYSLPINQDGLITSNGNPDNCLSGTNLDDTEYIEVEIDLGQLETINDVFADILSLPTNDNELILYIDDVAIGTPATLGITFASWANSALYPTTFPMSGQLVRIRIRAKSGNIASDIRIDNILVDVV